MANILDGFTGKIPPDVSIEKNVQEALDATQNMSAFEKVFWFQSVIDTNKKWDYKNKIGREYTDFGNFHYGVIAKALFKKWDRHHFKML